MWLKNRSFQRLGGGFLEQLGLNLWSRLQLSALRARKDPRIIETIEGIVSRNQSLLSAWEQYMIRSLAYAQSVHDAAMAEVGVYRGASARLISEVKGDRPLYLFDTFEGLPESSDQDRGVHREHQYACSLESVQKFLEGYANIHYFPGIFPASAANVPDQRYSFAHFDVDLYEGTKGCLEYFYPRMIRGGIMVSHDYGLLAGVEQAFQEFFADKPERIIDLPSTQCMVVKL
ncbi:MAG: TylF/MycF/NovP-related O-methyltransferase [Pirellulaceae bacterium]